MQQLRDFCDSIGVATEVRKFRADDVQAMPLPAIWQLYGESDQFHYSVVYAINENGIYALDGTTGEDLQIAQNRFTGYALISKRSSRHLIAQVLGGSVLAWMSVGLNITLLWVLVRYRSRSNSAPTYQVVKPEAP